MSNQSALEKDLNSFDPAVRRRALEELVALVNAGHISVPPPKGEVNLHFHTFFSYNANDWSPSRIAWESKKYGLEVSGIVDFDVLDGMEEFLNAGDLLNLKSVVGLETRVFIQELKDKVMSSPNEPGIAYFMASGCFKRPLPGTEAEKILVSMAEMARKRNLGLVERVNDYLGEVQVDYVRDVIPLTPSGNATERHLLRAYELKAAEVFGHDLEHTASFWARKLDIPQQDVLQMMSDTPRFHEKIRAKLMKFGGVGYVLPDSGSFPSIEDAVKMIHGIDALPMIAWLDGTNAGEEDTVAFLGLLRTKGVVAINIIPDRNWNIKDPAEKALKVGKLKEVVEAARDFHMPISVGTEMNRIGQRFVDDFSAPELLPYVGDFLRGARCLYGHTLLARHIDFGWFSNKAGKAFGRDESARLNFFAEVGRVPPSRTVRDALSGMAHVDDPGEILAMLRNLM